MITCHSQKYFLVRHAYLLIHCSMTTRKIQYVKKKKIESVLSTQSIFPIVLTTVNSGYVYDSCVLTEIYTKILLCKI